MPKNFPPLLRPFSPIFSATSTVAPVRVLGQEDARPALAARLLPDGVEVKRPDGTRKTITPPAQAGAVALERLEWASCEWTGDPLALAAGAATAVANGVLLTVVAAGAE